MKYLLTIFTALFIGTAGGKEIYECKYLCSTDSPCSGYECCTPWRGYIVSTETEEEYMFISSENDNYLFYKTDEFSWWNTKKLDEYRTKFDGVDNQILTIDKENNIAQFDDGPDHTTICIKQ